MPCLLAKDALSLYDWGTSTYLQPYTDLLLMKVAHATTSVSTITVYASCQHDHRTDRANKLQQTPSTVSNQCICKLYFPPTKDHASSDVETTCRKGTHSMRGPVGSQFLMAVAYLSSRGPSYRFSTLYFCALSGEGRCQIIISSSASEAGSHACRHIQQSKMILPRWSKQEVV